MARRTNYLKRLVSIGKPGRPFNIRGLTRLGMRTVLNQGHILKDGDKDLAQILYRKPELQLYDNYLTDCQYDHLDEWDPNLSMQQMDLRQHQPKKIFSIPKIATDLFCSHITTEESRLLITCEDDEEKQELIDEFIERIMIWPVLDSSLPSYFANGSMFIRFYVTGSKKIIIEGHNTKYVYPEFDDDDELAGVIIRFIYETEEYNEKGERIWRWSQTSLGKTEDIEYDEPIFDKDSKELPDFKKVKSNKHGMGFVQGAWFKTSCDPTSDDGESFIGSGGVLDYLDDYNYMASKESSSIYYHLFPILGLIGLERMDLEKNLTKMAEMGVDAIQGMNVLSTGKGPQESDIRFLEAQHAGMGFAAQLQDKNIQLLQYCMSIVLLDPEKVAAHAQSGSAMKALFRPVVQFIKQKRPLLKYGICDLLEKIEAAANKHKVEGAPPVGTFQECKKKWGNIFNDTVNDIQIRAAYTSQLKLDGIISRKTAIEHIASDFGIKNIEEELKNIEKEQEEEQEKQLQQFGAETEMQAKLKPNPNKPDKEPKRKGNNK